jgi:hypothetical protein
LIPRFTNSGLVSAISSSGSFVSWGSIPITVQGGLYRLCWCTSVPFASNETDVSQQAANESGSLLMACVDSSGFKVDLGSLSMIGPTPLVQDRTCVSGQTCSVDGLAGLHLSGADLVLVLDTCGTYGGVPRFSGFGHMIDVSASGSTASWGSAPVTVAGGQYRLCWCAGQGPVNATDGVLPWNMTTTTSTATSGQSFRDGNLSYPGEISFSNTSLLPVACSTSEHFRVDMGHLELVGVSPLSQHRTCVAGQTCSLDGITGLDLSSKDRFLVLDTCTRGGLLPRFPEAALMVSVDRSGAQVSWGDTAVTSAGGQHRLCWCAGLSFSCSISEHFSTDMGTFTIIGVSPLAQDRTCINGVTCNLDGIRGRLLSSSDTMLVLDTCGKDSVPARYPASGGRVSVSHSGAAVGWGTTPSTAAGGSYRLCWCDSANHGCTLAESFRVDAGRLTLLGPSFLSQDRTCISGQTCMLDGLLGVGFHDSDNVMLMDTCAVGINIPRMPESGLMAVSSSGMQAAWATDFITAAGGSYRMCWCGGLAPSDNSSAGSSESRCDRNDGFRVDFGTLTLVGASPLSQHRTCTSGQTCSIDGITGQNLSSSNTLLILDTCGVLGTPERFAAHGLIKLVLKSGSFASWGSTATTSAGGEYRLCWCAGPSPGWSYDLQGNFSAFTSTQVSFQCSTSEHYRVDMGGLVLVGVSPLSQSRTCVSGQTCLLESIEGQSLQESDRYFMLDTCGSNHLLPRHITSGQSVSLSASGAIVSWGSSVLTAAGGSYRLCWCGGSYHCSNTEDFRTDLGLMTIVGVSPLFQDRTCVSGRTCAIDSLDGHHVSSGDLALVLDTCGLSSVTVPRVADSGLFTTTSKTLTLDGAAVTGAGGVYRLCWCAASQFRCSISEDFRVDAGRLTLVGSSPLTQGRTCVSGQTCVVEGLLGTGIAQGDRLLVLDTCGTLSSLHRFSEAGLVTSVTASGSIALWGDSAVTAAGGQYRLCWCSMSTDMADNDTQSMNLRTFCNVASEFVVDMGELVLVGVAPLAQDRTCVSGRACILDGIQGKDLADGDRILILETCGTESIIPRFVSSHLNATLAPSMFIETTASGARVDWGSSAVTAAGGSYRLCWCSPAYYDCSIPSQYRVDAGTLTLIGVSPLYQDHTCVSGRTCALGEVTGHKLAMSDAFIVLDTCGTSSKLPRFVGGPGFAMGLASSGGTDVWWGSDSLSAAGGEYRLCWCSASNEVVDIMSNISQPSPRGFCAIAEDFKTDFGRMLLLGPSPLSQDRTCVSGQSCTFDGINGFGLSSGDQFLVADTCAQNTIPRFAGGGLTTQVTKSGAGFAVTTTPTTGAGGQYRLCWCAGSGSDGTYNGALLHNLAMDPCSISENFRTDAGELLLIGPSPLWQHRTCISGQSCWLDGVLGVSLSSADAFAVLDTCGSNSASIGPGDAGIIGFVGGSGALLTWESSLLTSAGGVYQLCWCAASHFPCSTAYDFRTDWGTLTLIGVSPLSQDRTCVSGQTCSFDGIVGQDLSAGNQFIVLDTCGTASTVPNFVDSGLVGVMTSSGARVTWNQAPTSAAGGQYRLCWCGSPDTIIALSWSGGLWPVTCSNAENFRTDAGGLTLIGPSPLYQHATCVSGRTCSIDGITSVFMSSHDKFIVLDTCATSSVLPRFAGRGFAVDVSSTGAVVSWGVAPVTASGGEYRLCWCAGLQFQCGSTHNYHVDLGKLVLVGVSPLSQDRTCVSGQMCELDGITGTALQDGDAFLVLDTCSTQSTVPRFSRAGTFKSVSGSGMVVSWGDVATSAAGGLYRLCWCASYGTMPALSDLNASTLDTPSSILSSGAPNNRSSPLLLGACNVWEDFNTDAGSITVVGLSPLYQDRTCVSGQTCSLDGILGVSMVSDDLVLALDTCGRGSIVPRFPGPGHIQLSPGVDEEALLDWGSIPLTPAGGEYRLCWCAASKFSCISADAFRVDVGTISIIGVDSLFQGRTCVSGQSCAVDGITGKWLAEDDRFLISDTCGLSPGSFVFPRTGLPDAVTQYGTLATWGSSPVTIAGGEYLICWCAGGFACSMNEHFRTHVGGLTLIGPSPLSQDQTCVSGQTCILDGIVGQHLSENDNFMILDTCSTDSALPRFGTSGLYVEVAASGALVSWGGATLSSAGGRYRLCWCAGSPVLSGIQLGGFTCSVAEDFHTDLGQITIVGVSPLYQDKTCISGQTCSFDGVSGVHLSTGDQFMVLDTCAKESTLPRFVLSGSFPSPGNNGLILTSFAGGAEANGTFIAITSAGGEYRLCWCAGFSYQCSVTEDFRVDAGRLTLVGVSPLHQDRTCISGQTCSIDD